MYKLGRSHLTTKKLSNALRNIVTDFAYVGVYCQLYPNTVEFSFFRPNALSSRLDRLYVPHLFATSCFIAHYIPTLSDHSAFVVFFTRPASASAYSLTLDSLPFTGNSILPFLVISLSHHCLMTFGLLYCLVVKILTVGRPPGGSRWPSRPSGPSVRPSPNVWPHATNIPGVFSPEL
jgi:hypothetical protein